MHAIDRSVKKKPLLSLSRLLSKNFAILRFSPHRTAQKIHSSLIKFKARKWIERE
jgi:hypothetical protein